MHAKICQTRSYPLPVDWSLECVKKSKKTNVVSRVIAFFANNYHGSFGTSELNACNCPESMIVDVWPLFTYFDWQIFSATQNFIIIFLQNASSILKLSF